MTRGKHQRAAAARAQRRDADEIAKATAELEAERARHRDTARKLDELRAAAANHNAASAARDRAAEHALGAATAEHARLAAVLAEVRPADQARHAAWNRAMRTIAPLWGNDLTVMARLLGLTDGEVRSSTHENALGTEAIGRLRVAQGRRSAATNELLATTEPTEYAKRSTLPVVVENLEYPWTVDPDCLRPRPAVEAFVAGGVLPGSFRKIPALPAADRRLAAAAASLPLTANPDSAYMWWHAGTGLRVFAEPTSEEGRRAYEALGAVDVASGAGAEGWTTAPVSHWPPGTPTPEECWQRDGLISSAAGRMFDMFDPLPRYARPGDAVIIRHVYAQQVTAATVAASELPLPRKVDFHDERSWVNDPPSPRAAVLASVREQLLRSIVYWLPPGEAAAFADSDPLGDDDIAALELPFPSVLIVPAEPLVLPAAEGPSARNLYPLDSELLDGGPRDRSPASREGWVNQMPFADALAARDSRIEAILVNASPTSGLDDRFAWCVAVPHAEPMMGVLGRALLPARLSQTAHAHVVRNLVAAVTWADWHAPEGTEPVPVGRAAAAAVNDPSFGERERSGGAGDVRVLNVRRTYDAAPAGDAVPSGRKLAPHLRRGHWQRYRTGNRATWDEHRSYLRRRVRATVVNAGQGAALAPQIYRLTPILGDHANVARPPDQHD